MRSVKQRIRQAVRTVELQFPVPGYIDKASADGVSQLATELLKVAPPPRTLLDIGCGPMDKTAVFQQLGYTCAAVDDLNDPWHQRNGMHERIESFARKQGIQFRRGTMHEEDGETGSFDVVTLLEVIEHLHASPRGLLNCAGRLLRAGGILCLTVPNAVNARKRVSVLLGRSNYPPIDQVFWAPGEWRGHVREYTMAEARFVCASAGFVVVKYGWFETNALRKLHPVAARFFTTAARAIAPGLLSSVFVLAQKPERWRPVALDPEAFRRATAQSVPAGVR